MTTGSRIKQRRLELGLSADDLGKRINKNRATIYRYESNDIENLPTTVIPLLAKALETTPAYIMGWEIFSDEDIANAFTNDCLEDIISDVKEFSPKEKAHFKNYIKLLEINRKKVDDYTNQLLSLQQMESELNAAHARTDVDIPNGVDTTENDIMDSENF